MDSIKKQPIHLVSEVLGIMLLGHFFWLLFGVGPWLVDTRGLVCHFFFKRLDVRVHRTSIHGQTTGLMGWMLMSIELATTIDVASFRYPLTVAMQLQYLHTSTYWLVHLFVPLVYIRVRDYIFFQKAAAKSSEKTDGQSSNNARLRIRTWHKMAEICSDSNVADSEIVLSEKNFS